MTNIEQLQMLTQTDVATILNCNKDNITMLRELGVIKAIKTGRNYMFSRKEIENFMNDYAGLDVSNLEKAIASMNIVENKRRLENLIS